MQCEIFTHAVFYWFYFSVESWYIFKSTNKCIIINYNTCYEGKNWQGWHGVGIEGDSTYVSDELPSRLRPEA